MKFYYNEDKSIKLIRESWKDFFCFRVSYDFLHTVKGTSLWKDIVKKYWYLKWYFPISSSYPHPYGNCLFVFFLFPFAYLVKFCKYSLKWYWNFLPIWLSRKNIVTVYEDSDCLIWLWPIRLFERKTWKKKRGVTGKSVKFMVNGQEVKFCESFDYSIHNNVEADEIV